MARLRYAQRLILLVAGCAILAGVAPAGSVSDDERSVIWRINHEHYKRRIHSLVTSETLSDAARDHACEMARTQTLRHSDNLSGRIGGNWTYVGENVGTHWDLYELHLTWMGSPGHSQNILDWHYDFVGAGVCTDLFGQYWVAVIFTG